MDYAQAVNRLRVLEGHVSMTGEAKIERLKASFNLEEAKQNLWKLFPKGYFDTLNAAAKVGA